MDKHFIGKHAGIVWRTLNADNRKWEFAEIKQATNLDDIQLAAAIGWLSREDKVQLEIGEYEQHKRAYIYLTPNVYY